MESLGEASESETEDIVTDHCLSEHFLPELTHMFAGIPHMRPSGIKVGNRVVSANALFDPEGFKYILTLILVRFKRPSASEYAESSLSKYIFEIGIFY